MAQSKGLLLLLLLALLQPLPLQACEKRRSLLEDETPSASSPTYSPQYTYSMQTWKPDKLNLVYTYAFFKIHNAELPYACDVCDRECQQYEHECKSFTPTDSQPSMLNLRSVPLACTGPHDYTSIDMYCGSEPVDHAGGGSCLELVNTTQGLVRRWPEGWDYCQGTLGYAECVPASKLKDPSIATRDQDKKDTVPSEDDTVPTEDDTVPTEDDTVPTEDDTVPTEDDTNTTNTTDTPGAVESPASSIAPTTAPLPVQGSEDLSAASSRW
eukprot:CAMPEP_0197864932 /NCGR_PEP_ID=MMETSP1438-20131217/43371_1 /TAXON_ID=1461541 /ORGANISM="Pterosperma sp., Strain CCMP1384" /LENGTH=268 /DNA_ID=CAMNT_0043483313 /DNA_START=180 /DNA_END=983 /DNA_ORIENTATION=+